MHQCSCGKEYKRLKNFQEHRALCEMLKVSENENVEHLNNIPSQTEMWFAMKKLIKKNERLEKKINELTSWVKKQKKKLSLIDWLNDKCKCSNCVIDIINESELNQEDLSMVVEHDLIKGIVFILERLINEYTERPIKAFDQKLNTLFIYNTNGWKLLDDDELKKFILTIRSRLIRELKTYTGINQTRIDMSDTDEWYLNISKVMGYDDNELVKKVRFKLYDKIKYNLKNIIEYEFTY